MPTNEIKYTRESHPGGFVVNSFVMGRDGGDPLFCDDGRGRMLAFLDGYAVIPMEEHDRLKAMDNG